MAYEKRLDGRKLDETRPIEAKTGVIERADGSAMFKIGDTIAYAAVYGPRELYPRFMQDPEKGIIRVNYNMMPFSGSGDRIRPGPNRRAKEISMVIEKALLSVVDLDKFPNSVVDIFIELPQTDAGTRCAGICASAMALADAGIVMKDLVSSVAVGSVDSTVVADLSYDEEAYDGVVSDIPIAILPNTEEIVLLQMDGEISKENLLKAVKLGKKVCKDIYKIQKKAIKEKYELKGESKKESASSGKGGDKNE
ncbi:exosome complex exonuclease Rrp41 [Candidatus Woesearchaeota archaeon]|nr:exosome complex exonuclease Rrp41 [Candidatus Woesearchaeota archaeon]